MPLIREDIFVAEVMRDPRLLQNVLNYVGPEARQFIGGADVYWDDIEYRQRVKKAEPLTPAIAKHLHSKIREALVDRQQQMHKGSRPWDFSPRTMEHLNRAEPWWGFEFETGWANQAARAEALAFTYDNFDGVMYDSEGEGAMAVEITFMPAERSKYLDGTADACRFMQWVDDHRQLTYKSNNANVGTHLNMSHPGIANQVKQEQITRLLNRTIMMTQKVNGQRAEMFGRETVYGGFYSQTAAGNVWTEFKGFRTPYTMEQFKKFLQVSEALQQVVELGLRRNELARSGSTMAVSNLYDMAFKGAKPKLDSIENLVKPAGCAKLYHRHHFGNI